MCLRLVFLLVTQLAAGLRLSWREETWKTAEILILRHQLAVLQRRQPRPCFSKPSRSTEIFAADSFVCPAWPACHLSAAKRAPARALRCPTKLHRSESRRCSPQESHG